MLLQSKQNSASNLSDADYAKLAGRAGGQTIKGGTASGEDLTLTSTSHATKGDVILTDRLVYAETGLGVNTNFELRTRTTVTGFPAAYFAPTAANKVMAFDVMPCGAPTESVGNGFSWVDVCNADIKTTEGAVATARVAIKSTGAEFGSQVYGGHASMPVLLSINGTNYVKLETTGVVDIINAGTAPTTSIANGIKLYSQAGELKVRDSAGNTTTLSPHKFELFDKPNEMAWSYHSETDNKIINIDMFGAIEALERLTGQQFIFTKDK